MLFDWFGRAGKATPPQKSCQPLRAKPGVESLEDRFLPNAIRLVPGFTSNSLPAEDDAPSQVGNLGFTINFFGVRASSVFVNNNGDITIGQPLSQFTPTSLNSNNGGIPIIAPFFADVDTRVGPVVTYGAGTLCGLPAFAVNYIGVGYFDMHLDKTNSFQVILIDRSDTGQGNFDIEFNYNSIRWETGDASGGTNGLGGESARVGYSNGTGVSGTFAELPGSGVPGSFLNGGPDALASHSIMAGTPGRVHFLVRNGNVVQMQTMNDDITASTKVFFPFRYQTDAAEVVDRGNLTLVNVSAGATGTNGCLDETMTSGMNGAFPGPLTVVFTGLPAHVQLLNASGVTASGHPFLTIDVSAFPPGQPVVRAQIELLNPGKVPPTTFAEGFPVRVFSGPFDPTMV